MLPPAPSTRAARVRIMTRPTGSGCRSSRTKASDCVRPAAIINARRRPAAHFLLIIDREREAYLRNRCAPASERERRRWEHGAPVAGAAHRGSGLGLSPPRDRSVEAGRPRGRARSHGGLFLARRQVWWKRRRGAAEAWRLDSRRGVVA